MSIKGVVIFYMIHPSKSLVEPFIYNALLSLPEKLLVGLLKCKSVQIIRTNFALFSSAYLLAETGRSREVAAPTALLTNWPASNAAPPNFEYLTQTWKKYRITVKGKGEEGFSPSTLESRNTVVWQMVKRLKGKRCLALLVVPVYQPKKVSDPGWTVRPSPVSWSVGPYIHVTACLLHSTQLNKTSWDNSQREEESGAGREENSSKSFRSKKFFPHLRLVQATLLPFFSAHETCFPRKIFFLLSYISTQKRRQETKWRLVSSLGSLMHVAESERGQNSFQREVVDVVAKNVV